MALKTYTIDEFKDLVLEQVNKIKKLDPLFEPEDADEAYEAACRDCGFEFPSASDEDLGQKYKWIAQRMKRWFADALKLRYSPLFDQGDAKAEQVFKHWQLVVSDLDAEFNKAKEDSLSGHLFSDVDYLGGNSLIVGTGFVEYRLGQDIAVRT